MVGRDSGVGGSNGWAAAIPLAWESYYILARQLPSAHVLTSMPIFLLSLQVHLLSSQVLQGFNIGLHVEIILQ